MFVYYKYTKPVTTGFVPWNTRCCLKVIVPLFTIYTDCKIYYFDSVQSHKKCWGSEYRKQVLMFGHWSSSPTTSTSGSWRLSSLLEPIPLISSKSLAVPADWESPSLLSSFIFRSCFLCFILRFWNHVLTWKKIKLDRYFYRYIILSGRYFVKQWDWEAEKVRTRREWEGKRVRGDWKQKLM